MIDEENTDCLYLQRSPYAEMWWEMYSVLSSALSWSGGQWGVNYCSEFCSSRKLDSTDSVNMFGVKFNLVSAGEILSPLTVSIHLSLFWCLRLLSCPHLFCVLGNFVPLTLGWVLPVSGANHLSLPQWTSSVHQPSPRMRRWVQLC